MDFIFKLACERRSASAMKLELQSLAFKSWSLVSSSKNSLAYTDGFICGWIYGFLLTATDEDTNTGYEKFSKEWSSKAIFELQKKDLVTREDVCGPYKKGWLDGFQNGWNFSNLTRRILLRHWNERGILDVDKYRQTKITLLPGGGVMTSYTPSL